MIRTEKEYKTAVKKIKEEKTRLQNEITRLQGEGFGVEEIKNLTDPIKCFHEQLVDEVDFYERLIRGEFGQLEDLSKLGPMLIAFRVFRRMSQKDLAERLGVSEACISRDERNEYHGVTISKAERIMRALGIRPVTAFEPVPSFCGEESGSFEAVPS